MRDMGRVEPTLEKLWERPQTDKMTELSHRG